MPIEDKIKKVKAVEARRIFMVSDFSIGHVWVEEGAVVSPPLGSGGPYFEVDKKLIMVDDRTSVD